MNSANWTAGEIPPFCIEHKTSPFTLKAKLLTEALIDVPNLKANWDYSHLQFKRYALFVISTFKGPSWDIHAQADVPGFPPQAKCSTISRWPRSDFHCPPALPLRRQETSSLTFWHADYHTHFSNNKYVSKCIFTTELGLRKKIYADIIFLINPNICGPMCWD